MKKNLFVKFYVDSYKNRIYIRNIFFKKQWTCLNMVQVQNKYKYLYCAIVLVQVQVVKYKYGTSTSITNFLRICLKSALDKYQK